MGKVLENDLLECVSRFDFPVRPNQSAAQLEGVPLGSHPLEFVRDALQVEHMGKANRAPNHLAAGVTHAVLKNRV